jgi:UDP-N-acetylglucosamine acyltransferase
VDPLAELGTNVSVGPFAWIEAGARIGDGCEIGPHVAVFRHTTLGPNCRVHAGAALGDLPQDVAFKPVESFARIGANCVIREGVTIHRGTKAGTATETGEGCYLMAFCHLAHNVRLGNGVIIANGALLAGYVDVGDRAFISGNCAIHQFVRIGRLAMLGGMSALSKDVPPFCTVGPLSFNTVSGLNVVGMRRAGLPPESRAEVRRAFRILYLSGLNVTQATEEIRAGFQAGPALEICAFAEQSARGICRFAGGAESQEEGSDEDTHS